MRIPAAESGGEDDEPEVVAVADASDIAESRAAKRRHRRADDEEEDDKDSEDDLLTQPSGQGKTDTAGVISVVLGGVSLACILLVCCTCGVSIYVAVPLAGGGAVLGFFAKKQSLKVTGMSLNCIALVPALILTVLFITGMSVDAINPVKRGGPVAGVDNPKPASQPVAPKPAMMTRDEFKAAVMWKSSDDVIKAVGKPRRTSESGTSSYWYYDGVSKDEITGKTDHNVQVIFEDGLVKRINF